MGKLIIMRHAESVFGSQKKYSGVMDIPLSSKGIKQAIDSASTFPEIQFDIVYTSSLIRSLETALIYLAHRKNSKTPVRINESELEDYLQKNQFLPIIEKTELQEREYGFFQGRTKKELEKHFDKETIFKWRRSINQAPPGGESLIVIIERILPFFQNELQLRLENGCNILIVAHQSSIRALYYLLFKPTEIEIESIDFENSAFICINYENNNIQLIDDNGISQNYEMPNYDELKFKMDTTAKIAVCIFAGGAGTRMKDLTKICPKPLIKVNGKPLIDYLIDFLSKQRIINRTYVIYSYLKDYWEGYIQQNKKKNLTFIYEINTFSLINNLFKSVQSLEEDLIVVISGDMVFNYEIILNIIEQHINSKNDITVALNESANNCYKIWEYILFEDIITNIVLNPLVTNTERYFFIINRQVIVDYTNGYTTNMGETPNEFDDYIGYNKGWTCLIKKLIDCKKYVIKAIYLNETVINVNDSGGLSNAESYLSNQDIKMD